MALTMPIDPGLHAWPDLANRFDWSGLLIGNGASRAVWRRFEYRSLLTITQRDDLEHQIGQRELDVFTALGTTNFESVLFGLRTADRVNSALGIHADLPRTTYEQVRRALIEAVHWIHLPWDSIDPPRRKLIRDELLRYQWVYSTNYDLIVYWSMMLEDGGFVDFFWSPDGLFDPANTEVRGKSTRVLYLHGAIHLETDLSGQSRKRHATIGANLLQSFQAGENHRWLPLFVSEGTSTDKVAAIARSDYLSFAYQALVDHDGPISIFGHSLGNQDHHLVRALNAEPRVIAIGILPAGDGHVVQEKGRLKGLFPKHFLYFYDASTHPLGAGGLRVEEDLDEPF